MPLKTFAFTHPLRAEQLQVFRTALPALEFLVPDKVGIPPGIERAEAAAITWDGPPIDEILAAGPALRWIHQRGAGIERILTPRLAASPVVVTNGSGNHAPNIAEHVLALMLAFARQLPALMRSQQQGRWDPPASSGMFELGGQTLAVVGVGAIGIALAERARGFGMRVVGVRRTAAAPMPPGFERVVGIDSLDDALGEADHVALSLPATPATQGLFSTARFAAMKRGAYLYNVGRGVVVDQEALLAALQSGHLAGAGLDVTTPEPLPPGSPLWREPNVIVTAHTSGLTPRSFQRYQALLLENLLRESRGEPLLNVVDKSLGY
jgi:phosphoglycerate dehydrogenase-like enzyme